MKKGFSAAIAAVLVLATIGIGVASLFLGRIVKSAVEAAGPRVLGAPVRLGEVLISPWSGRGTLRGLVIGNPPGFAGPYAASVASVEVEIQLSSLLTDTVVLRRVAVRGPELVWETGPDGSNLTKLQRNAEASAERYMGSSRGAPAAPAKGGKSLFIGEFSVSGGKVGLVSAALGGRRLSAELPDLRLTNLGGKGRSPAEAAAQAFRAVTGAAQGAVANAGGKALHAAQGAALSALGSFFRRRGK